MGLFDGLKAFANSVETEYDRRIKAASNVKEYYPGGHAPHHGVHEDDHAHAAGEHIVAEERLQGEGGIVGDLQAHAGPQDIRQQERQEREQGTGDREQETDERE